MAPAGSTIVFFPEAQRLHETGLDTYRHTPAELTAAIGQLLTDRELHQRLASMSATLQAARGTERAADLIEQLAARA